MSKVKKIRQFNRSVSQHIGALNDDFLGRSRSLGLSRVLFEIGLTGIEVRQLRQRLGLDSGYTSRLINSLEKEGLLTIECSPKDARVRTLALTNTGVEELNILNQLSDKGAKSILKPLCEEQQDELIEAMETVIRYYFLSQIKISLMDPLAPQAQGCIEKYYKELSTRFDQGFDPEKSISANPDELRPPNGYLLVVEFDGQHIGCGALKCQPKQRWVELKRMWVDPQFRGKGIGQHILKQLEKKVKVSGFKHIRLETNRALKEAQSLYRKNGYKEVPAFNDERYAHHWFEKTL